MKVFVISLKEAVARRERVSKLMALNKVEFEFIDAVKGVELTSENIAESGLHTNLDLSQPEIGVLLSHIKFWKKMVEENYDYAVVLEDDVHLSRSFRTVIEDLIIPEEKLAIYRLETSLLTVVKISRAVEQVIKSVAIQQIYSCHPGTAGYALNKASAKFLLSQVERFKIAVDNELFDPKRRNIENINIYQCNPAVVVQDDALAKFNGTENSQENFLASKIGESRIDNLLGMNKKNIKTEAVKDTLRPLYLFGYNFLLFFINKQLTRVEYENEW